MTMEIGFIGIVFIVWAFYAIVPTILLSFLQWFLCGKDLRYGKILPIIAGVFSILAFLFFLLFTLNMIGGSWLMAVSLPVSALLLFNVPTLVYILIYRARKRRNEETDLTRMKINDLE